MAWLSSNQVAVTTTTSIQAASSVLTDSETTT